MEFTDYMWLKLGLLAVAAFVWNFLKEFSAGPRQPEQHDK
jgi:hypothetical protein